MALKQKARSVTDYFLLDFETGGLDQTVHGLTEIAIVAIAGDTLEQIGAYEAIIAPHQILVDGKWKDAEYTPKALELTGLSMNKLNNEGRDIDEVAKEVKQFFIDNNRCKSKLGFAPVCVAHNATFDRRCLQELAAGRFELKGLVRGDKDFFGNFVPHMIDTIDIGKYLYAANERMTNFTLKDVLEKVGIPLYDAHRAMNDVRPMTEFFQLALRMLREADKTNLMSVSNASKDEDGKIVHLSNRTFKFQIPA